MCMYVRVCVCVCVCVRKQSKGVASVGACVTRGGGCVRERERESVGERVCGRESVWERETNTV